jgi:membrane protease YdiL (CAAX protease family)
MIKLGIVISALFFGIAHWLYGGGWEFGKILPAAISGLVLGWLYVEKGFPAAVVLHWLFNYFASSYDYLKEVTGFPYISTLLDILVQCMGILFLLVLALRFLEKRQSVVLAA